MGANNSNLKQAVKDEYNRVQSSGAKHLVRARHGAAPNHTRSQQHRQVNMTPDTGSTALHCSLLLTRPAVAACARTGFELPAEATLRGLSAGAWPCFRREAPGMGEVSRATHVVCDVCVLAGAD